MGDIVFFIISIHMTPILTEVTLNFHLRLLQNATRKKERARKRKYRDLTKIN